MLEIEMLAGSWFDSYAGVLEHVETGQRHSFVVPGGHVQKFSEYFGDSIQKVAEVVTAYAVVPGEPPEVRLLRTVGDRYVEVGRQAEGEVADPSGEPMRAQRFQPFAHVDAPRLVQYVDIDDGRFHRLGIHLSPSVRWATSPWSDPT
ncbi:hypothetical protein ACWGJB_37125 [Streptomyces sp. NPDC054813]